MTDFLADVKAAGGRAIPLKVKGAFHSPFMKAAAEAFERALNKAAIKERNSPVQWEKIIRNMITDGIDTFIEIGPGKTLTNMIKKISTDIKAVNVIEYLAEVEGC